MIEDLRTLKRAEPFNPFIIHTVNNTFPIDSAEDILFTAGGNIRIHSQGEQWIVNIDQITVLDLRLERPPSESEIDLIRKWKQERKDDLKKKGFTVLAKRPKVHELCIVLEMIGIFLILTAWD